MGSPFLPLDELAHSHSFPDLPHYGRVFWSFHNFDFAPAKNFVEKKSPRQHGVPAQTERGTLEFTL